VLEGALLVYRTTEDGHVGVLCEAGEWFAVPTGILHCTPRRYEARRRCSGLVFIGRLSERRPGHRPNARLPSFDAFVEEMRE